jgi:ABC-type sugar transport system ATPase subunit
MLPGSHHDLSPALARNRIGRQGSASCMQSVGKICSRVDLANGADPAEMSIEAVVEVIERLGSEILLDVAVGQSSMVASVEPTVGAKVHEHLRLAVNPLRLHFFDNESEAAI